MNAFVDGILTNGLAVWAELGGCFIGESDSFLASTFMPYVSRSLREYLLIRQGELKEPYDNDAVLQIPFHRLAERCLNWDLYLERFPNSPLREQAELYYRDYLVSLLLGMDNCPVLDSWWQPKHKAEWLQKVDAAYDYIVQEYPHTRTARLVRKYHLLVK